MHATSDDEFERRFDAGEDVAGYIDVSAASRPNQERRAARRVGMGMFHVYEFEIFEDEGWFLAFPFDFLGGTQGESYAEACEMAADWLRVECEHRAMRDEGFPPATFGNEPRHGGTVVVVGVEASKDTVRKVTASEAARRLGVSPGRVTQMIAANQLEAFRDGGNTWVTLDSIEVRLAEEHPVGRPRLALA